MKYFYLKNDEKIGPVSFEELSGADINKDTLIWYEGIEDWTPMSKIEELESISKTKPPSIPKTKPASIPKPNLESKIKPTIYLDDNGITIKASETAIVNQKYELNGEQYLLVGEIKLREMVNNDEDISNVVTTKVYDMKKLLWKKHKFNQNISSWDVSNVKDMHQMFSLAQSFNQDISNWDVSNVRDMSGMFFEAKSFNQNLSGWKANSLVKNNGMFKNATAFDHDISSWDISNEKEISFNDPLPTSTKKTISSQGTVSSQSTKMSTKKLVFIAIGVLVLLSLLFNNQSSSSSSSSSTTSACNCTEKWLALPRNMMPGDDKWKYDECKRKYGGFAGANEKCIASRR
jgi:surface protein